MLYQMDSSTREKRAELSKRLTAIIMVVYLLHGCIPSSYQDISSSAKIKQIEIGNGYYSGVAWISNEKLGVLYYPSQGELFLDPPPGNEYQLYIIDTEANTQTPIPVNEEVSGCKAARPLLPERLPNNAVAILLRCATELQGIIEVSYKLIEIDPESLDSRLLFEHGNEFSAQRYTFSPTMLEFIQEERGEVGIYPELYRITLAGEHIRIAEEFRRAATPAWSPNGEQLAFAANETAPSRSNNPFANLGGAGSILYYPWNLYVEELQSGERQLLLKGVQLLDQLKWSPQGDKLTFTGIYREREGLWLIDVATNELFLIWPKQVDYDWHPEGEQLILLQEEVFTNTVTILSIEP